MRDTGADRNTLHTSVAILAGGQGTRLKGVADDISKPAIDIGGTPFFYFLLDQISRAGLKQVTLCLGHRAQDIQNKLAGHNASLNVGYNIEPRPLGTGGALRWALVDLRSDYILVMNGDSYLDIDLRQFIDISIASNRQCSIALTGVADSQRYGSVSVDRNSLVTTFCEKGPDAQEGLINAGLYLFTRECLAAIPPDKTVSLERETIPALIPTGIFAAVFPEKAFIDIGTPESLSEAQSFFTERRLA